MKRCRSDELQQQQGEEDGAGLEDAACHLPGADLRPGETAGANPAGAPSSDTSAAAAPRPGSRNKPPDLKVSAAPPAPGQPCGRRRFPHLIQKCPDPMEVVGKARRRQRGGGGAGLRPEGAHQEPCLHLFVLCSSAAVLVTHPHEYV